MANERTYGFREDDAEALLQAIDTRQQAFTEIAKRPESRQFVVILDAVLPAASHALTGASSCLATVCEWDTTEEEYTETAQQITVWNHAEAVSHVANTFGYARWIDAHWHFFGDCDPMAAR
jgi:cyclopropane fatty-acyl-phospholipid synthase-like methyltransferase